MHRLTTDHIIYDFTPAHAPALTIASGAELVVETLDSYSGFFDTGATIEEYLRARPGMSMNPATGPIAVHDVQPGDGLTVSISDIRLGKTGYVAVVPGIGVLGDGPIEPYLARFTVRPDGLWYEDRIRLPLRPNLGTIGVAPAAGAISTLDLGDHGGNLDCNDITTGTVIHFPVHVPGALLALGDAHAGMSFGEVYSGVNIRAEVTLRIDRVPAAHWDGLWFETATEIMLPGIAPTVEEAIHAAVAAMTALLQRTLHLTFPQAVALTGAICDIRPGQTSKFGVDVSVYAVAPKGVVKGCS
jgi:amidase